MSEIHGFIVSFFIVSILACYSNIEKRQMEFTFLLLLFGIYMVLYILFGTNNVKEGIFKL